MKALVDRNKLRTHLAMPKQLKRTWHLVDAKGQILGRLSTKVALLLSGRRKLSWSPQIDVGDNVVVINTTGVRVTGRKVEQKIYYKHTTYLGHLKATPFKRLFKERPNEVVRHSIAGMLPVNRQRAAMLRRLYLFTGSEHRFSEKFK